MDNETIDKILKRVEENIDKPFVTAKFGMNWKKGAKKYCNIDTILDIAYRQGRKSLLLEQELRNILQNIKDRLICPNPECRSINIKQKKYYDYCIECNGIFNNKLKDKIKTF